jgi:hypothetical protein
VEKSRAVRGKCLIVNNTVFRESKIFESINIFTQLYFKVKTKDNLKALEIINSLSSLAKAPKLAEDEVLLIFVIIFERKVKKILL